MRKADVVFKLLPALGALLLVAASCSNNDEATAPSGSGAPSGAGATGATGQMEMQPGAADMHVAFVSPEPGFVLTGNTLASSPDHPQA